MFKFLDNIELYSRRFFLLLLVVMALVATSVFSWGVMELSVQIGMLMLTGGAVYLLFKRALKDLFLGNRFFWILGGIAVLFGLSFVWEILFSVAQTALILFAVIFLVDVLMLFHPAVKILCERIAPKRMSLGDNNTIQINIDSRYRLPLSCQLIDEVPIQFQKRDFKLNFRLSPNEEKQLQYELRPLTRGEFLFNNIHLFIQNSIGLTERRITFDAAANVPVYPSIIQMKQLSIKAFQTLSMDKGIKKMRRIGHSYEFEQIKNYVRGDDYRSINWKATSRKGQLMVNQYTDERAQQIYCVLDKSRAMKMPFNGLSLLDYAINATLVISNVALQKHDRAGLITFSNKIGNIIKADRTSNQLNKIMGILYRERERDLEASYDLLYSSTRRFIQGRSLVFLFTNFESSYSMERMLPVLRKINNLHLLVVVFFENTEMAQYTQQSPEDTQGIYFQTVARQFLSEKQQIVSKLRQYGIQSILTAPEDLSINTLNKYLELKARGLI